MAIIFHLLSFSKPMEEYEHMRGLLDHLEVPKLPIKHGLIVAVGSLLRVFTMLFKIELMPL
jgi:hypothetical protein